MQTNPASGLPNQRRRSTDELPSFIVPPPKKPRANTPVGKAVAAGMALLQILNRPEVREALKNATATTREWANNVKSERIARRPDSPQTTRVGRFLSDRFGAGALIRRLDAVSSVIADLAHLQPALTPALSAREAELRQKVKAAAKLPSDLRKPKLKAFELELEEFERAIADSIT